MSDGPNESQRLIAETLDGTIVVDAGPGPGKTETIVTRYVNLIARKDVEPKDVLLLTFTNNAANEMEERIKERLSDRVALLETYPEEVVERLRERSKHVQVKTFDAFCLSVIMDSPEDAGALFGIDERLTRGATIVTNESLNREHFRSYLDRFLNDRLGDYGDWAAIASQYPVGLFNLINRLMSRGVYPMAKGWFGMDVWGQLLGDTEALLETMERRNVTGKRGGASPMASTIAKLDVNDVCSPPPIVDKTVPGEFLKEAAEDEGRREMLRLVHDVYHGYVRKCVAEDRLTFGINAMLAFSLLYGEVLAGRTANVDAILDKMLKYQRANGGASLPSDVQVKAERVLNAVPFATVLFMVNLSAGLLLVVLAVYFIVKEDWNNGRTASNERTARVANAAGPTLLALSFTALTACLALRWTASGRVPMANGYETMLVLAWAVMLAALAACRRFRIIAPFGLLASGFFLLVSHISAMDPQITHVMPVLQSPLLSVHVSVIMMSFALLSLTFVCGVAALVLSAVKGKGSVSATAETERLALLSRLMLHPAVALLAVGVFVGAVWANVSWGSYWSWDAKETWGLITLLVYAVAVHDASLPFLRRAKGYHVYMVCAFLTIIMTYFGVNYFLGGMHSYA